MCDFEDFYHQLCIHLEPLQWVRKLRIFQIST